MMQTDFQNESVGPVHDSVRWTLGTGAASGMSFVSDAGDIRVAVSTGSCAELLDDAPTSPHQRAEVRMTIPSTKGAVAYAGIVLRYIDSDNFIYAAVNFNTNHVVVVERVAASETVIIDQAFTPSGGCAICVEVIGRRARLWIESKLAPIGDRPPDFAANLENEPKTGGWGMFMNSNGTNNMRITQFGCRDLPSAVMPPPDLGVVDASSLSLNLVPVSVTTTYAGGTSMIEWQVTPADPDDWPEAYTDLAPPSLQPRKFFVRPGYSYDFRARDIAVDGTLGAWKSARLTASGSKVAPASDTMPSDDFPNIPADYVMPVSQEAAVKATISDTGRERIQTPVLRPRYSVKLSYKNRQGAEIQTLIDFFDDMQGKRKSFRWQHPTTGQYFAMRFDTDDYTIKYNDRGDLGIIASFDLTMTEVWLGNVTTISTNLTLDEDA